MASARQSPYAAVREIDPAALETFRTGIRRRYSDDRILAELRDCAQRLGHSPTMREFADDPQAAVHPQTVIEHFVTWNSAKRSVGLVPRRFATGEELLAQLRALGETLGRTPTGKDLKEHRASMPSKSLLWHTFGSLSEALRQAGFDVLVGEERLERALEQGALLARRLGRIPRFADWAEARLADAHMLSEWQVYRLVGAKRGAWPAFQYLVRERLREEGVDVAPDGSVAGETGRCTSTTG